MDRTQALERALKSGARLAADMQHSREVLPSGLFALDWLLLHVGGVPVGRLVELFGPESAGKSLVSYRWIASAQRLYPDRLAAVWDTEASLSDAWSASWAARQGVDLGALPVYADAELERVFDGMKACVESDAYSILVVDSIADCYPKGMMETKKGKQAKDWGNKRQVGAEAGIITEFLKWLTTAAKQHRTTVVFVNQVRVNLNTTSFWGPSETTPGGKALRHDVALRLKLRRSGDLREGDGDSGGRVIGAESSVDVVKCKFAPRGGKTGTNTLGPLRILFDAQDPLDDTDEVIYGAIQTGVAAQNATWYTWGDLKVQGLGAFAGALKGQNLLGTLREEVTRAYLTRAEEVASGESD